MESSRRNVKKFGTLQRSLIVNRRDFLLLSLSITSGLLFFTICLYLLLKISSYSFSGEDKKVDLDNLDSLDTLEDLEPEKEEEEVKEEVKEEN